MAYSLGDGGLDDLVEQGLRVGLANLALREAQSVMRNPPGEAADVPLVRRQLGIDVLAEGALDVGADLVGGEVANLIAEHLEVAGIELVGLDRRAEMLGGPLGNADCAVLRIVVALDRVGDGLVDHLPDQPAELAALDHPLAELVELLALVVHHLVVFKQVLADAEVALLDLLLGAFDALVQTFVLDGHAFLEAEDVEHLQDPLAHEQVQEVVLEREEEA